jgi:predicted acetyltransferase
MTLDVRIVPVEDFPALAALSREAYGTDATSATSASWTDAWVASLTHSVSVGAYDAGKVVSHARVKPYAQWFGGRAVPMGGVASVAVAASHQGRGAGRATVAALLPVMRERGYAVSALFPSTVPLYRGLGWALAGDYTWLDVPATALRALGPPADDITLRDATEADVPGVLAAYARACRETNGMLDRSGPFFDLRPEAMLAADSFVVAERAGATQGGTPDGIEGYAIASRRNAGHAVEVRAYDVVGTTPAAARAVWFALGAGASVVPTVRAKAYPADLAPLLTEPAAVTVAEHHYWMLRLVDAPAAVAACGWPAGLAASVDLDVHDAEVPDNAGRWRLTVDDGHGSLVRGGDGTISLSGGALAALYAAYADPRTLRRAGELRCADDRALDVLATMTAGPRPRMLDYF